MAADTPPPVTAAVPLVRAVGLCKLYRQRRWLAREQFQVMALDGVDLTIAAGSTLALVGESGSGKSTLARCLARLEEPSTGTIEFDGENLLALAPRRLRLVRRRLQLIFQNPAAALNPRMTAMELIAEPLVIQGIGHAQEQRERALTLLEQVGLSPRWAGRRPHEFSGGQRQRLAIARALALEPKFLILDEALTGLDLSLQAQILNLLMELQARYRLTQLFITHDLSLVPHIADEVAVMQGGKIVERARPAELFAQPRHPHTRALLAALPALPASAPFPATPEGSAP